jgi:hypothetical protein
MPKNKGEGGLRENGAQLDKVYLTTGNDTPPAN